MIRRRKKDLRTWQTRQRDADVAVLLFVAAIIFIYLWNAQNHRVAAGDVDFSFAWTATPRAFCCYFEICMRCVSSAKLHNENHCGVHPCIALSGNRYQVCPGWELVGYAHPPWVGSGSWAIVYQKNVPANDKSYDPYDQLEPGIYWAHGTPELMEFVSSK